MKKVFGITWLILMLVVSACTTTMQASTPEVMETPTISVTFTDTPMPTQTVTPTATDTAVPTLTATATATATITLTPTPMVDLAGAKIVSMDYTGDTGMYVIFEILGIQQPYKVQINGFFYGCELSPKVANWLICSGQRISLVRQSG
jgi:hypothetical protein